MVRKEGDNIAINVFNSCLFLFYLEYFNACKDNGKEWITLPQIMALQKDTTKTYFHFIEYFISSVVGKNHYKYSKCDKLLSEYTTVSDEAFAILIYKNNFDTWKDMASKNITKNSDVT